MTVPQSSSRLDILDAELKTVLEASHNVYARAIHAKMAGNHAAAQLLLNRSNALCRHAQTIEAQIDAEMDARLARLGKPGVWTTIKVTSSAPQ